MMRSTTTTRLARAVWPAALTLVLPGVCAAQTWTTRTSSTSCDTTRDDGDKTVNVIVSEDGRTVEVQVTDGKVTSAKVDGKDIPTDRVRYDGNEVKILDEQGGTLARVVINADGAEGHAGVYRIRELAHQQVDRAKEIAEQARQMHGFALAFGEPADPPKVMAGFTLDEPDAALAENLGLKASDVTLVRGVAKDLPAAKAGFQKYDVIVAVDGKSPAGPSVVKKTLHDKNPGDTVTFTVLHKGQKSDLKVTLEAYDRKRLVIEDGGESFRGLENLGNLIDQETKEKIDKALAKTPHGDFRVVRPGEGAEPPGGQMVLMDRQSDRDLRERLNRLEERLAQLQEMLARIAPPAPPPPGAPAPPAKPSRPG